MRAFVKISLACSQRLRHKSFLLLFFKKEESSFSEEKEAKRLLFPALCFLVDVLVCQLPHVASATGGAALFAKNCAMCHGAEGRGDGKLAKSLPVPPANLTAPHVLMHSDGQMFRWLSEGIKSPLGVQAMPGFAGRLTENERWDLIDYIRAHNLGLAFRKAGAWPQRVEAPSLQARCGTRTVQLRDLRRRFVRLVIGSVPAAPPGGGDVVTIATKASFPGICVADTETVDAAYGVVSGFPPAARPGTQFLIDGKGFLRAVQPPGSGPGWDDPKTLANEIMHLQTQPVLSSGSSHETMKMPM